MGKSAFIGLAVGFLLLAPATASADFTICNHSRQTISVAFGYHNDEVGWRSEGWWRIGAGDCTTLLTGNLQSRYYYVYGRGSRGGIWQGGKRQDGGYFCTRSAKFTFDNDDFKRGNVMQCERYNLTTRKFSLVDTEDAEDFTYRLTE